MGKVYRSVLLVLFTDLVYRFSFILSFRVVFKDQVYKWCFMGGIG